MEKRRKKVGIEGRSVGLYSRWAGGVKVGPMTDDYVMTAFTAWR